MTTTDRTCLITGSSRGIGRGIAEHLGNDDLNVVVNYNASEGPAHEVVETIEEAGGSAIAVQADVTDREEVDEMRRVVHDAFGPIDVLVNNAGVTEDTRFIHMSREEWDRVMNVNLGGTFNCTQAFFEDIANAEVGRLINISSIVGKQGNFGQANYATAKSGMFGFTRTIALELASSGSTANCVAPGFTRTDMLDQVNEDIQETIRQKIPLKRFATIDDVAGVVGFIASEHSAYVTGEISDVNGGMDL